MRVRRRKARKACSNSGCCFKVPGRKKGGEGRRGERGGGEGRRGEREGGEGRGVEERGEGEGKGGEWRSDTLYAHAVEVQQNWTILSLRGWTGRWVDSQQQ